MGYDCLGGLKEAVLFVVTAFVWTLGITLVLLIAIIIYRLVFHPLAGIPGPRLAAVSNIWQAYHARNGRMLELGKMLHARYGSVVRVGPSEVWFDSREAFREIYGVGNNRYEKSNFYLATVSNKPSIDWNLHLHFPDTLDLLSDRDTKRYRLQRRLIGPIYQTSNIKKFEQAVDNVIERAIAQLKALDGEEVDLKEWMHIIAVECLGAMVLSWSPGYIAAKSDGGTSTQGYLSWKRRSVFGLFPAVTTAAFFSKGLGRLFSNLWGVTYSTPKNFKPFFTPVYHKTSKRITAALRQDPNKKAKLSGKNNKKKQPDAEPTDLLTDLINLHKNKPEFTERYLRRMAITNFGAGHETMCSAFTSVMTMIGSHPDVQQKIVDELDARGYHTSGYSDANGESNNVPRPPISYDDATTLTYTLASIKEAQRLYPVIGMSLSRKVPATGVSIQGRYYPPGTAVGCNPVALHRNTSIFGPNAGEFSPNRWLLPDSAGNRREIERYNLTWGGGTRTCPGRHLAEMVLYKVVPALVRDFEVEVTRMPADQDVEYYYLGMLTRVRGRFVPRARG